MENREKKVRQKMRGLIVGSCHFDKRPTKEFRKFHRCFLNFFFNSIDVEIDYTEKIISIWNSKPLTTDPVRLYDLNEAIADTVIYSNLEETLHGCLEEGHLQNTFYQKMLLEYGDYPNDKGKILSTYGQFPTNLNPAEIRL